MAKNKKTVLNEIEENVLLAIITLDKISIYFSWPLEESSLYCNLYFAKKPQKVLYL